VCEATSNVVRYSAPESALVGRTADWGVWVAGGQLQAAGSAQVTDNDVQGPGQHLIWIIPTSAYSFGLVTFAQNRCEHVSTADGMAAAVLNGRRLIVNGNHFKGWRALDLSGKSTVLLADTFSQKKSESLSNGGNVIPGASEQFNLYGLG
jgi:hypothetical protein